jgi:RHS repeat-associated protein
MAKKRFGSRSCTPCVVTALLGSLFLLVACGNDEKKEASGKSAPSTVEALCTDGKDDDGDGQTDCDDADCQAPGGDCVAAPALDRTVASTVGETAAVLYSGTNPLQKDADSKAFDPKRIAMLKGVVVDEAGEPLAGAKVSVRGHEEYGYTFTRKDGTYDFVVNGGTKLLLDFAREGRLDAQRAITPGWQRHHYVGSVGLTLSSGESSTISAEIGESTSVTGPTTSDDYGERQPLVIFQPGTVAEAVMDDGSKQSLPSVTVTVTEYPLDGTQQYLPGTSPMSGVSYGLDFAVAEAKELGASHVAFSEPVSIYVENFLELPVGTTMPLSYYDTSKGQWESGQTGNVLEILEIVDGKAVIDADGDGKAEELTALESLGVSESDLQQLAKRYKAGTQLMQGKVSHFSAYAAQVNVKAPKGAVAPNPNILKAVIDHPTRRGSILVEPRAVVEDIPVTGTPYSLTYQSNRTTAYVAGSTLDIPLIPATVPAGLKRVIARVAIAGKTYEATYPAKANQKFTVTWDGYDSLNRLLQGPQLAQVYVGYVYNGVLPSGGKPSKPIEVTLSQQIEYQVGQWDFKGYELGGFGIDVLNAYDPALRTIFFGNGNQRSAENVALVTKSVSRDSAFDLGTPDSLAVLPDGTLLITDDQQNHDNVRGRVLRVATDGTPSVLYGLGAAGKAENAKLLQPQGLVALDDGSVIVVDSYRNALSKIDTKGNQTVLVSGDEKDKPEVQYSLTKLDGIAVGFRQELYIIDGDRLLKLEGGKLTVFLGGGTETTDGVRATDASIARLSGVTVDSQGCVVVSEREGNRVRKVLIDGTITTIAGKGSAGFSGDGGNAVDAELSAPRGLALGPDGSVYVVDQGNNRIRRITPDGLIQTVIGGGSAPITEGVLATNVKLDDPDGIAMGPDGALYIATMSQVLKIYPALPDFDEKDYLIPSEDGHLLYKFDQRGKHLETIDAMTGVTLFAFEYTDGYLSQIIDKSGVTTSITRDEKSHFPKSIDSQYGQTTRIELLDDGWLAKVTDPLERTYELTWNAVSGRLDSVKYPTKKTGTYRYDGLGKIEGYTNPTGYEETLKDLATTNGSVGLSVTTPSGNVTQYAYQSSLASGLVRTVTSPDATMRQQTDSPTSVSSKTPDGSTLMTYLMPDTAFGPQSMVPSESTLKLPSGKSLTTSYQRTKKLSDASNALALEEWLEETTTNGRLSSSLYNRDDNTLTTTSPMGRTSSTTFDDVGRPVLVTSPGLPTVELTYDEDGRVATIKKSADGKSRVEVRGYGEDGWIASTKNPLGETVKYQWDLVGRPKTVTRSDNKTISWGFNNADNVMSLTTPANKTHRFDYDADTQLLTAAFAPTVSASQVNELAVGQKVYEYGKDHELTKVSLSNGRSIEYAYANGLLKTQTLKDAKLTYGYSKGQLSSVNRSDGVKVELSYDGALPTATTWSGTVTGSVKAAYDANLWLSSLTVNDASTVNYRYDDDGLVTSASCASGAMTMTRDPDTGMVTSTTLGKTDTAYAYTGFGELKTISTSILGTELFGQSLERDELGRVTNVQEQADPATHELLYTYDNLGRIKTETRDGVTTTYGYDANGNRTSVQTGSNASVTATYDAQDRILTYGSQVYTHSPVGNLETRTDGSKTVALTYDDLGNLTKVVLSEDDTIVKTIDYVIDGLGRRVARRVNGTFDRKWLYRDGLRPVAEVDSAGVFTHFVYVDSQSGAPDFLIRSGVLYRVVKDHLGSVRLVVNATSGAIAQSLEYDAFGRVLNETGAAFQPFGFAGGLYDADTKLVRFGARDYDPGMGRWTNKDPIGFAGGDTNVYAYVGNDPVNLTDPTGLSVLGIHSNVAGAGKSYTDGHAWITYTDDTGVTITYGLWPDSHRSVRDNGSGSDIRVGMEDELLAVASRYYTLTPEQEARLVKELTSNVHWSYTNTCAAWASEVVVNVVGEDVDADDWFGFATPRELGQSILRLERSFHTTPNEGRRFRNRRSSL